VNDPERVVRDAYAAFNARDIGGALAHMQPDVDWPNAWEGGRVHGHNAVRDYWTRQWQEIDPTVEPTAFTHRDDGTIAVTVHQLVKDRDGKLLVDSTVTHVYTFDGDLVSRMDVEQP